VAGAVPEPEQRVGEAQRHPRRLGRAGAAAGGRAQRPRHRGPQVVLLRGEARHRAGARLAALDVRRRGLGHGEEVPRVRRLERVALAGRVEALARVLAHRLEQR
jgi:hypothetical protein